mmetsp:Transcript_32568/g.77247  ORF Transcript_32568/g.77247 Transcript_32568/m.77247 type:complete len:91 (-) Transcript_32568:216-488(-)
MLSRIRIAKSHKSTYDSKGAERMHQAHSQSTCNDQSDNCTADTTQLKLEGTHYKRRCNSSHQDSHKRSAWKKHASRERRGESQIEKCGHG